MKKLKLACLYDIIHTGYLYTQIKFNGRDSEMKNKKILKVVLIISGALATLSAMACVLYHLYKPLSKNEKDMFMDMFGTSFDEDYD